MPELVPGPELELVPALVGALVARLVASALAAWLV